MTNEKFSWNTPYTSKFVYGSKINTNSCIQKNYLLDIYSYITEISRQTVKLRQSVVRGKNRNKWK